MRKVTGPAHQQRLVDEFNARCRVGGNVNVRLDSGEVRTTRTRSEAQLLGGHTAVVWLEGIAGAYLLSRVSVLPLATGNSQPATMGTKNPPATAAGGRE